MTVMGLIGTVLVWLTFFYQLKQIIAIRRNRKRLPQIVVASLSKHTGLSPTQVRAALDAGEAQFEQRIKEMGGRV